MGGLYPVLAILWSAVLTSCSSNPFVRHHPQKAAWIASPAIVAVYLPSDKLMVSRSAWFAGRTGWSESLLHDSLVALADKTLDEGLRTYAFPGMLRLSTISKSEWGPVEGRRVSEFVFVRGHFPPQGKKLQIEESTPQLVLFMHEVTLGLELGREKLYDIRRTHQISLTPTAPPKYLTLVASWTLWDNLRQQSLSWGISEAKHPISSAATPGELRKLFLDLTRNMATDLGGLP